MKDTEGYILTSIHELVEDIMTEVNAIPLSEKETILHLDILKLKAKIREQEIMITGLQDTNKKLLLS